jgi:hypothetical protein
MIPTMLALVLSLNVVEPSSLESGRLSDRPVAEKTRKTWLWATGLSLAVTSYVAIGAVTSALCSDDVPAPCQKHIVPSSWVPLAGPWVVLPTATPRQAVALITGGVAELAGVAMLIAGLILKEDRVVVAPMASAGRVGVSLRLTY